MPELIGGTAVDDGEDVRGTGSAWRCAGHVNFDGHGPDQLSVRQPGERGLAGQRQRALGAARARCADDAVTGPNDVPVLRCRQRAP